MFQLLKNFHNNIKPSQHEQDEWNLPQNRCNWKLSNWSKYKLVYDYDIMLYNCMFEQNFLNLKFLMASFDEFTSFFSMSLIKSGG
jgi:hypothetical protein